MSRQNKKPNNNSMSYHTFSISTLNSSPKQNATKTQQTTSSSPLHSTTSNPIMTPLTLIKFLKHKQTPSNSKMNDKSNIHLPIVTNSNHNTNIIYSIIININLTKTKYHFVNTTKKTNKHIHLQLTHCNFNKN